MVLGERESQAGVLKDLHVYYHVLTRNFFVYYEIDNDESKHALALSEHGYLTATRRSWSTPSL